MRPRPAVAALLLILGALLLAALGTPAGAAPGGPGSGGQPLGGNSTAPPGNSTSPTSPPSNQTSHSPGNQTASSGGGNQTAPTQGNQTQTPDDQTPSRWTGNDSATSTSSSGNATSGNGAATNQTAPDVGPLFASGGNGTDATDQPPADEAGEGAAGNGTTGTGQEQPMSNGSAAARSVPGPGDGPPDGGAGGEAGDGDGATTAAATPILSPDVALALTKAFATSTGVAFALVLAALARPQRLLWLLPLLPLFNRIARGRLLEHAARRHLLDLIEASPGIHYRELERRAGRGHGAVEHHLRSLARAGLVRVHVEGGRTRYFPPPARGDLPLEQRSVLLAERARHVLGCVARHGALPLAGLARAAGLPASTLHACVGKLRAARLVESVRIGREVHVGLTDDGRRALASSAG